MTAASTADYDTSARANAVLGQPLPLRMAGPATVRRQSNFADARDLHPVWRGKTGLSTVDLDGNVVAAAPHVLGAIVGSSEDRSYLRLAPLDRSTRSAMLAVLGKAGDRFAPIHRELTLLATLPVSSTLITVADVLARKMWLPLDMDPADIGSWAAALGFDPSDPKAIRDLLALAGTGEGSTFHTEMRGQIARREDRLLRASRSLSPRMQAVSYAASRTIHDAWEAIERTDVLLRGRGQINGDVVHCTDLRPASTAAHIAARVNGLSKLSAVREIGYTTVDGRYGIAVLAGLGFDAASGQMTALLARSGKNDLVKGSPTAGKLGWDMLHAAMESGEPVWVTGKPFLVGYEVQETRWNSPWLAAQAPPIVRDMPLAIAVAGAPTDAPHTV